METARLCVSSSLAKWGGVLGLQVELGEGGQHTKAEEREPLIKGTSQFLSGKQALVKVYSGRRSFGKCELSCSFTALLQDWGKKVIMRRKGKKWQKPWEVGQRIPVRKTSVSLWVLG